MGVFGTGPGCFGSVHDGQLLLAFGLRMSVEQDRSLPGGPLSPFKWGRRGNKFCGAYERLSVRLDLNPQAATNKATLFC